MRIKSSLFLLLAALLAPWAANAQDNNTIVLDGNKDIAIQPGQTYNFYDSGGPDNNYGKEEDYTLTLTCDGYITINFSQFQTEPTIASYICSDSRDYMLIYDGEVSDDNLITRGQTGCSSSLDTGTDYVATSGIMTIKWKSNNATEDAGWVATITGVCAPVVVNSNSVYTENFDSYTSHTNNASSPNTYPNDPLPQCWQFINRSDGSYPPYPKAFLTSNYAVSGNCLLLNSSGVKDLYAILPEFEGNISGYQLTFTYRNYGTTDDDGTLYVGYMTNPNDTTTFVQTLECSKRAALTTKAAFFLQAPQGSYIAFKYGDGGYDYDLYIDDVVVSIVPSCIPTGTPTCGELSAHTAKLSWDLVDATQTAWEVEYSTSPEFAGALTVDADTHEDFELTDLVAETTYYARVRAKCGNDDYSAWSETITFTTFNTCPVPFNLAANNLTAGKADLSWTGSIDVPSYDVRHRKAYHVIGDYERFDTRPDGWDQKFQELDRVLNGEGWEEGEASGRIPWMFGTQNGVFDSHAYLYDHWISHYWLITDSYTVKSSDAFNFDLALTGYNEFNTTDFLEPEFTETNYRFIVLIIKDSDYNPGPAACKEWEILREWNNTGSEYVFNDIAYSPLGEHVSIDLSEYVGQTVRIAFYGESSQYTDGNTLHIDNMAFGTPVAATPWETKQGITANTATVTEVLRNLSAETEYEAQVKSNCPDAEEWCAPLFFTTPEPPDAPTGLQVVEGSITDRGASFSWDGEPTESFQYSTVTNPQEGFEPTVWTNVPGNTVNVTDAFTPNRVARFYLRKDCGDDGLSKYTYVEFRTGCGTMVIDDNNSYTENFDSYTAGTSNAQAPSTYPNDPLPQCWQFLNRSNGSGYPQVFISTHQDYIVSGNCLFFKSSYSTPLYAILPEFAQPVANLQVTFTYRNERTTSYDGTLHVGYLTDPSDASTFVSTLECRKTTELTTMTAYFPHAPEQGRMAFMYKGGDAEPYHLSIDDVEVSEAPSCLYTGTLSCGELSSRTAKLSWDLIDATQTAWEVQYSTSQDFAEYSAVIADRHEDFVLDNLEPETQYYARVRARCSDEAFSAWCETITFTTFSTCPVPFNLAVSNITQVSAVLSWSGTIDVQSYDVRYKSTAASSWRTIQDVTANTAVLSNLNTYTQYEAQVKSNCSNPEAWSASFVFETGYSGIVPTGLQVVEGSITDRGASFIWDGAETESFQYCAVTNPQEGFDPTDWINVQGNTVRLENAFTPNRPARFYLRKDFGNQAVSRYAYVDFHTDCGPMRLSFDGDNDFYFEDFEGYEGNSCIGNEFSGTLPRCWDGYFTSQYQDPEVIAGWAPHIINNGDEYCYYHHSGTNSLFFFGREYGYAALPYFDNPISTLRISFWMKRDAGGTLVLGYIKSGDVNYNTFTPIAEFEDSYFSMVQHSKDLNEVPAEATRLVFRWFSEGASYECCIDDVKVSLLPTCQPPTGLAVGNVTSSGATFTWEAEADETFQYFTISNPPADFEPSREINWTVVHGNTLNLTNVFAPHTLVRFYLRKGCGDGGYSDYTSVAFRTICDPISPVNYSENFDSYTDVSDSQYPDYSYYPFDPLPDCWRFLTRPEESYDNPQVFISSNSSYANSWDNCLFFRSSTTTPIYAVLPEFEENISGYQLTFVYRQEGTSESNGTLYVGYMTDPDD
ncbi:MAG: fibronectin type III domain-containing protein, partial [Bacteroidales bacterium]|nr:fibronectin type III domain-containing protein [Bacteroidales bacterium]